MSITLATIAPQAAYSITIKQPYFGYSTSISMDLRYSRTQAGYKIGDNAIPDTRICEIPTWLLDATDQLALSTFFNDLDIGRGNNFTMALGSDASGFFPFGPDKGDKNTFVCSLLEHDKKGIQLNPYQQWLNTFKIVYVSGPSSAYTPASAEAEGTLSIGTVTTLRPCQTFPQALHEQGVIREVSRGGLVSSVDLGGSGDLYETDLDLDMRPGNAAALITYLTTVRNGDIDVSTPANTWLFGMEHSYMGDYTCKNLSPKLTITHDNFNLFKMRIKLWMKSDDTLH